jgi:hypothetical protein
MPHTIAALAAVLALACASGPPKPPPPPPAPAWTEALSARAAALEAKLAAAPPAPAGELVVRLAFEPGADLDLYVSDPLEETVYYANTPARSGGALEADRRCREPGDGVETVRFAAPRAGRYRVGVDFQHRCDGEERVAPWVLSIDRNVFASRVDEFVYSAAPARTSRLGGSARSEPETTASPSGN